LPVASIYFLGFLFLTVLLFSVVPAAHRRTLLIIASCFFVLTFSWQALCAAITLALINYAAGRYLTLHPSKAAYFAAVTINIYFLVFVGLAGWRNHALNNAQVFNNKPVVYFLGVSFYTLQNIAYLADVFHRRIAGCTSFPRFLLSLIYFPKIVCGPVTIFQDLYPQLSTLQLKRENIITGINRILLGFFKKLVIADRLSLSVGSVFDHYDDIPGLTVFTGSALFLIQVYFDFSGYTDIAIGTSRIFGIVLPENFNFPFGARSLADFWRRWHMTLIGFLTRYVFYPVTFMFRRYQLTGTFIGICCTFVISALWHGIGPTFLVWCAWNVAGLLVEVMVSRRTKIPAAVNWTYMMIVLIISYIYFRAPSWDHAAHLSRLCFHIPDFLPGDLFADFVAPLAVGGHQADIFNFVLTLVFVLTVLIFERKLFSALSTTRLRPVLYFFMILIILMFGQLGDTARFIYMQF
jgi:alginate O-acetyltransferase complex protein AlgI